MATVKRCRKLDSSDWTMRDPADDKKNPQVDDIASGVPYFGG